MLRRFCFGCSIGKRPGRRERKAFRTLIAKVDVEMVLERQMDCIGPDPAGGGYLG